MEGKNEERQREGGPGKAPLLLVLGEEGIKIEEGKETEGVGGGTNKTTRRWARLHSLKTFKGPRDTKRGKKQKEGERREKKKKKVQGPGR